MHKGYGVRMPTFSRGPIALSRSRSPLSDVEMQMQDSTREVEKQRSRLADAMFGSNPNSSTCLKAYFTFLDHQIEISGSKRLAPLLSLAGLPEQASLEDFLHVVADVATVVKNDDGVPSKSIHSILQGLLRLYGSTEKSLGQAATTSCWQAIFTILCWLTALVKPDATSPEEPYKLVESHAIISARRPFTGLLHSADNILPDFSDPEQVDLRTAGEHASQIYVSSLNYWSLRTIGRLKFQWTDSLSSHLYFRESNRTLYLFRFPSLCALILETKKETPFFKRLLLDYSAKGRGPKEKNQSVDHPNAKADEPHLDRYLQEVLLSYRVLFGQSRSSRKLFLKREKSRAATANDPHDLDPLLSVLCAQREAKSIRSSPNLWPDTCYHSNGELLERDVYDAALDFRFLGDRLLAIQAFNSRQRPSRVRDMWRDRRDPLQWYTFWLVLIVGGLSLLLSITQCSLGAAQLYSQMHSPTSP